MRPGQLGCAGPSWAGLGVALWVAFADMLPLPTLNTYCTGLRAHGGGPGRAGPDRSGGGGGLVRPGEGRGGLARGRPGEGWREAGERWRGLASGGEGLASGGVGGEHVGEGGEGSGETGEVGELGEAYVTNSNDRVVALHVRRERPLAGNEGVQATRYNKGVQQQQQGI